MSTLTVMTAHLVETHIKVEQGDTVDLVLGPVLLPDLVAGATTPIDLTTAGMMLRFTAKTAKADTDAAAKIRKRTTNAGGAAGEVTVDSPASAANNWATIRILPADTTALTVPATGRLSLFYDVQLEEPDGRVTTLARGKLEIVPDVTDGT